MVKRITISIVLILVSISLAFCGKKEEEPKPEVKDEVKTEVKTESSSSDLGAKIKAYEDFVTKFCALSEKMKGASVKEKATLANDFKKSSETAKTLEADLDAAKASPEQQTIIANATKKAAGCAAVAVGATPSTPSLPKTPAIPTKAPSMPKM